MENKPHMPDVIQEEKLRRIRYFLKKESLQIPVEKEQSLRIPDLAYKLQCTTDE